MSPNSVLWPFVGITGTDAVVPVLVGLVGAGPLRVVGAALVGLGTVAICLDILQRTAVA